MHSVPCAARGGMDMKRPAQKLIDHFRLDMIGDDRVEDYLRKEWSLIICCKGCPRMIEWAPQDLKDRFGERPEVKIADIAAAPQMHGR